jgi:hypothetical protein
MEFCSNGTLHDYLQLSTRPYIYIESRSDDSTTTSRNTENNEQNTNELQVEPGTPEEKEKERGRQQQHWKQQLKCLLLCTPMLAQVECV